MGASRTKPLTDDNNATPQPAVQSSSPGMSDPLAVQQLSDPLVDPLAGGPAVQMDDDENMCVSTPPTPGSATVVGSAQNPESAYDATFTPALIKKLNDNPHMSLDEVLTSIVGPSMATGDTGLWDSQPKQNPTIYQYGQTAENTSMTRAGQHLAVLVANQNYASDAAGFPWVNLATPHAEAGTMRGALSSRGYTATVHNDQTSKQMSGAWNGMVGKAKEGDDLVAYYGGHGDVSGLAGVQDGHPGGNIGNDIYTNAQIAGLVSSATTKGAHIRFISDACHSGGGVQAVREERANELAEQAEGDHEQVLVLGAQQLMQFKTELESLATQYRATHDNLHDQMAQIDAANADALTQAMTGINWALFMLRMRIDALWQRYLAVLNVIRFALTIIHGADLDDPPQAVTNYRTLGEQLTYIDLVTNACMQPVERRIAEDAEAGSF